MFCVTGSEPALDLSREELWRGLVRKAEDPCAFVAAITECRVLERRDAGLVREIVVRGERVRERVTFEPGRRVRFERLSGPVRGTILNEIERDLAGELALRFTFALEADGRAPGSLEERAYFRSMARAYMASVRSTLAETRRLAARDRERRSGRAPAAAGGRS